MVSCSCFFVFHPHPLQTHAEGKDNSSVAPHYGSMGGSRPPGVESENSTTRSSIDRGSSTPLTTSAKPLGQFSFLKKSYSVKTPSCLVPRINELFKSICDRYDVATVNREKVDEALTLFKQVIGVDRETSMEVSFLAWKACLSAPKFTVSFKQGSGDVNDIRVRAKDIPRERRKAQKHIRDLLDACHLFLQQKDFLQRHIKADMIQLTSLSGQLQNLGRECGLSGAEKKQLPKTYSMAREQFSGFGDILDTFFVQVYSLMNEINMSVHVLEARESSAER